MGYTIGTQEKYGQNNASHASGIRNKVPPIDVNNSISVGGLTEIKVKMAVILC
jgi:hypothetical protein